MIFHVTMANAFQSDMSVITTTTVVIGRTRTNPTVSFEDHSDIGPQKGFSKRHLLKKLMANAFFVWLLELEKC